MMFVIKIGDDEVILDADQMETLTDLVQGASIKKNEWVGGNAGDDGTNYVNTVRPYCKENMLRPHVMHDDLFVTMEVKTKLFDENKKK
jgi:hypothetical protein